MCSRLPHASSHSGLPEMTHHGGGSPTSPPPLPGRPHSISRLVPLHEAGAGGGGDPRHGAAPPLAGHPVVSLAGALDDDLAHPPHPACRPYSSSRFDGTGTSDSQYPPFCLPGNTIDVPYSCDAPYLPAPFAAGRPYSSSRADGTGALLCYRHHASNRWMSAHIHVP